MLAPYFVNSLHNEYNTWSSNTIPSFFQKVGLYFARAKVSFANTLLFFGVNYNLPRVQRFALYFLPNLQVTMVKAAVSPSLARKLLATQAVQDRLIENDNALLRWAIENNQELVVDLLLDNDTVKNTLHHNDNALLVWTVENNFETYWKKLVAVKKVVDKLMYYANKYRYPTLYWAAANNHQNLFDYMIQKDRDINSADLSIIFKHAIQSNNLSCIQHLIKNYINKLSSYDLKYLFTLAVHYQNLQAMHELLTNETSKKAILPSPDDTDLNKTVITEIIYYVAGLERIGWLPRDHSKDKVTFKIDAMKLLLSFDVVKKAIKQFGATELLGYIAAINDSALVRELLTHDVFFNTLGTEGNKFLRDTIIREKHDLAKFLWTLPPVRTELTRQYADNLAQNPHAIILFESIAANQELHTVFKSDFPELNLDLPCLKIKAESKKPLIRTIYDSLKLVLPLTFSRASSSAANSPVEEPSNEANAGPSIRDRGFSLD